MIEIRPALIDFGPMEAMDCVLCVDVCGELGRVEPEICRRPTSAVNNVLEKIRFLNILYVRYGFNYFVDKTGRFGDVEGQCLFGSEYWKRLNCFVDFGIMELHSLLK